MARNTLTRRAAAAQAKSAGALNLFRTAASELEAATKDHESVANEAASIAEAHAQVREYHERQAVEAANAAAKLRGLVGGAQ